MGHDQQGGADAAQALAHRFAPALRPPETRSHVPAMCLHPIPNALDF
jgi:hypothetical protein